MWSPPFISTTIYSLHPRVVRPQSMLVFFTCVNLFTKIRSLEGLALTKCNIIQNLTQAIRRGVYQICGDSETHGPCTLHNNAPTPCRCCHRHSELCCLTLGSEGPTIRDSHQISVWIGPDICWFGEQHSLRSGKRNCELHFSSVHFRKNGLIPIYLVLPHTLQQHIAIHLCCKRMKANVEHSV